jgi:hypothetical protein
MNSTNGSFVQLDTFFFAKINSQLNYYFFSIAIPVGTFFNTLAILVFSRPRLNRTNVGFVSRCLACGNIATLLFMVLVNSDLFFSFDFNTCSDASCAFITYTRKVVRELSPAIETLFTVDRFINVVHPGTRHFLQRNRNIALTILLIIASLMLFNISNVFYFVERRNSSAPLASTCSSNMPVFLTSDITRKLLMFFIPVGVMLTLNCLMVRKLKESRLRSHGTNRKKECDFNRTLMLLNIIFVLLNFPVSLLFIVKDGYLYTVGGGVDHGFLVINFLFNLSLNLPIVYNASFFFLNYLSNRIFREECAAILVAKNRVMHSLASSTEHSGTKSFGFFSCNGAVLAI